MLLDKMTTILARGNSATGLQHNQSTTFHTVSTTSYAPASLGPVLRPRKSLNRELRHRNLVKIMNENAKMLKRLQSKSPSYSIKRWQIEDAVNVRRVEKIS